MSEAYLSQSSTSCKLVFLTCCAVILVDVEVKDRECV